ncbi:transposase [Elysia marginata]|uniref:Transposase n=1 Tax=Elysia marginata TaxID=1093978 RepID=A0AAV4G1E3_9GAST|nr:transposase [Elysia marginata]
MTWKHPSSPVTKKFKVQTSAAKVMATVLWDAKAVIVLSVSKSGRLKVFSNIAEAANFEFAILEVEPDMHVTLHVNESKEEKGKRGDKARKKEDKEKREKTEDRRRNKMGFERLKEGRRQGA